MTIIIPTIPEPVCCSTGAVAQWYMNTPAWSAVNRSTVFFPGAIVLKAVSGFTSELWKSMLCGTRTCISCDEPLKSVISTSSPCLTTIGADAPFPRLNRPLIA